MRIWIEVFACVLGAVFGVAWLWWLGAPLELWSAGVLVGVIGSFSVTCLAGGPLS